MRSVSPTLSIVRHVQAYLYLAEPLRKSFGLWLTASKTQQGMLDLHSRWALQEEVTSYASEVLLNNRGGEGWHRIGFKSGLFGNAQQTKETEDLLAQRMLRFSVVVCGLRLALKMTHSHQAPGIFVLLISKDRPTCVRALKACNLMWEAMCSLNERCTQIALQRWCCEPWSGQVFHGS